MEIMIVIIAGEWGVGGGWGDSSKLRLSSLILLLWKVKDGFEYYDPFSITKK